MVYVNYYANASKIENANFAFGMFGNDPNCIPEILSNPVFHSSHNEPRNDEEVELVKRDFLTKCLADFMASDSDTSNHGQSAGSDDKINSDTANELASKFVSLYMNLEYSEDHDLIKKAWQKDTSDDTNWASNDNTDELLVKSQTTLDRIDNSQDAIGKMETFKVTVARTEKDSYSRKEKRAKERKKETAEIKKEEQKLFAQSQALAKQNRIKQDQQNRLRAAQRNANQPKKRG